MVRSNRLIADYQKALALSNAFDFNSPHRDIKVSTYAILFFGTPHHGANGVELAQWMGKLSSIYMYTNETILKDLNRDSGELESIQKFYLGACEHIKSVFFYETLPTPIKLGVAEMVSSLGGCEIFALNRCIDCPTSFGYHRGRPKRISRRIARGPSSYRQVSEKTGK
jgi:hypothetical protein